MLARLQRQLERTYEVAIPHAVEDFVITDPALASRFPSGDAAAPETLFVSQQERAVDVGLFIEEAILEHLVRDDPTAKLHPGNLGSFLIALEGVSHFLYLVWNAGWEKPVSRLELELQAEVDKFFAAAFLFAHQIGGVPPQLRHWLFEEPVYRDALTSEAKRRYEEANHYAAKLCARLERRYLRGHPRSGLMHELRRFYRLPQGQKLDYIQRLS